MAQHEIPEAKSLHWLANMFPFTENPKDDTDKMSNAIHAYAEAGALKIEALQAQLTEMELRYGKL